MPESPSRLATSAKLAAKLFWSMSLAGSEPESCSVLAMIDTDSDRLMPDAAGAALEDVGVGRLDGAAEDRAERVGVERRVDARLEGRPEADRLLVAAAHELLGEPLGDLAADVAGLAGST